MTEKISLEDVFIKIIPGGVIIGVIFYFYGDQIDIKVIKGFDFLYTFTFIVFSYLVGEIIQTISHELEWMINIFFKFYRPSEIFYIKITL